MKKIVFVFPFLLVGCGTMSDLTSGVIGCSPNEIQTTEVKRTYSTIGWKATCRGETYYCVLDTGVHGLSRNTSCKSTQTTRIPSPVQTQPNRDESKKSSGTGFYVSSDGYLITNEHVVESCATLNAIDEAGQKIPLHLVRVLKSDDLALLKASITPSATAVFRDTAKINQGEAVVAYGYPLAGLLASGGNVSTGLVTALAGLRDDSRQLQISAPVQSGNSGGPLVDSKGLVIGVVVSKLNAIAVAKITSDIPQNVNFAIKSSSVINLLDASSVRYRSETRQRDLSVETLTQQMRGYTVKIECN